MEIGDLVARIGKNSRTIDAYSSLRRSIIGNQLVILYYHRVAPDTGSEFYKALEPEVFEAWIKYIRDEFEVIPLVDLARGLKNRDPPKKSAVITFDDGYRDIYDHAYPILRKYSIPATVFIATGHIDTGDLFWWDKIWYAFDHTEATTIRSATLGNHDISSGDKRVSIRETILQRLKSLPDDRKSLEMDLLLEDLGVEISPGTGRKLVLSWKQIGEMVDHGIDMGAHTVSHVILDRVDNDRAREEIERSKLALEREANCEVNAFSYPNGTSSPAVRKIVEQSGYSCAVSADVNRLVGTGDDVYDLGRIDGQETGKLGLMISGLWGDLRADEIQRFLGKVMPSRP